MCGVAGIFDQRAGKRIERHELALMLDTIRHRGPDARGILLPHPGVGLAHARLAILDLSPDSNQPFESADGRYVISYNGEIFNYLELREELRHLGHRFRTNSDTEVLVTAYAEWGERAIPRLNGMWAFAIYDRATDLLFCSRDRFGAKPFYFAQHNGRFLFASEIKALVAAEPSLARPNLHSFARFFRSSDHSELDETFFQDVKRLGPAENLLVTRTGLHFRRYWDYPTEPLDLSAQEAADGVRDLLRDALRLRMRSDVPVGSTLSGGLDSSALACLLRTFHSGRHQTFTASFPGEPFDEAPRAIELARSLGMEPYAVPVEADDLLSLLNEIVYHLDAPTQSPAVIPLWNIMRSMQGKVVVALDGQGADEAFGGYIDRVFGQHLFDTLVGGQLVQAAHDIRRHVQTWGWWTATVWSIRDLLPRSHRWYRRLRGDEQVYTNALPDAESEPPVRGDARAFSDRVNAVLQQQHQGGLRSLLQYGDAISMAHSIETRMPYLDYRLVEMSFRLPGSFKVAGAQGKVVLREAVRDLVPPDIVNLRRKVGFATPISQWTTDLQRELIEPVLYSEECRRRGLLDPARLRTAIDRHVSGKVDLSSQLLRWTTAELWFQRFVDRTPVSRPVGKSSWVAGA